MCFLCGMHVCRAKQSRCTFRCKNVPLYLVCCQVFHSQTQRIIIFFSVTYSLIPPIFNSVLLSKFNAIIKKIYLKLPKIEHHRKRSFLIFVQCCYTFDITVRQMNTMTVHTLTSGLTWIFDFAQNCPIFMMVFDVRLAWRVGGRLKDKQSSLRFLQNHKFTWNLIEFKDLRIIGL